MTIYDKLKEYNIGKYNGKTFIDAIDNNGSYKFYSERDEYVLVKAHYPTGLAETNIYKWWSEKNQIKMLKLFLESCDE